MQGLEYVVGSARYEPVSDAVFFRAHHGTDFVEFAVTRRALERLEGSTALDPMLAAEAFHIHRDRIFEVAEAHYLRMRFTFGQVKLTEAHFEAS